MPYKDKDQQKQAQHESYLRNKEKVRQATIKGRRNLNDLIRQAKEGKPCHDCGVVYPHYVMDFDHRIPSEKIDSLGRMSSRYGKKSIEAEIEKCDLVCSNCHRERTHQQGYLG